MTYQFLVKKIETQVKHSDYIDRVQSKNRWSSVEAYVENSQNTGRAQSKHLSSINQT